MIRFFNGFIFEPFTPTFWELVTENSSIEGMYLI